ncbi:MAG: glycosyltransferase [Candidatus Cloacimonetes bacterium]|nr:glycosyltransferase [Candidatus Cloacimonadota bacterium]MDD4156309.1 glycosyltransferase [Candidatus Cloacimonadota bacterium]
MLDKKKFKILGFIPPPYGGLSIHIFRLLDFLDEQKFEYDFYNYKPNFNKTFLSFFFDCINFKKEIIHLHEVLAYKQHLMLLLLIKVFNKRVILTIHNNRFKEKYLKLSPLRRMIFKKYVSAVYKIIAVNSESDFVFVDKKKIINIPAYIAPINKELTISLLPKKIIELRDKYKILLTANASRLAFYKTQDLYGLDMSINLVKFLIDCGVKDLCFIFVLTSVTDESYYNSLKEKIHDYEINEHMVIINESISYPALLSISDIFLRPTNTDGYSISVSEALSLKKIVIASDVCPRPKGTLCFKARDQDDLNKTAKNVVDNLELYKNKAQYFVQENFAEKLLLFYNSIKE